MQVLNLKHMKKKHWAVMAALILIAGMADNLSDDPAVAPKHACIDTTHASCDGECLCDGYECE